jgi:hypothetical protein
MLKIRSGHLRNTPTPRYRVAWDVLLAWLLLGGLSWCAVVGLAFLLWFAFRTVGTV